MMKQLIVIIAMLGPVLVFGQSERKYIREGVKAYESGDYSNAEVEFGKAEEENEESYIARFNTSTALYQRAAEKDKQETDRFKKTSERLQELLDKAPTDKDRARVYHNIGNMHLESDQYAESIEAYKNSLRLNPKDDQTRYNLAYAQMKLKEQQQQQNQQNKDQQDQQQNQDQKDQQQNQDQQDQQQNQDQDQQKDQEQNNDQQQQPAKQQISKEEAARLLQAILENEKEVKEKVDKKKAAAAKIKTDKDW